MHDCMRAALLVYRGSGDASRDEETISQVLSAQQRLLSDDDLMKSLPVDVAVGPTDSRDADPTNAGLCLIITDRVTPPPSSAKPSRCGLVTDFADIRANWPGDEAYAIGIVYYWKRIDYHDQHSVTFLNVPSAEPGHTATIAVEAAPNTLCRIVVVDTSGATVPGLDPKTTDSAGSVGWTWPVDPSTPPGRWPITVSCGASSGWTSLWVYVRAVSPTS
jgi:hypothetical protein